MTEITAETHFCVLDLETTGLNKNRCEIIEFACIILNAQLREIASFESLVWPTQHITTENSEPGALELHHKTGLINLFNTISVQPASLWPKDVQIMTPDQVIGAFFDLLNRSGIGTLLNSPSPPIHLIGRNPGFDRGFLEKRMPEIEKRFHYRMIDVDSFELVGSVVLGTSTNRIRGAFKPPNGAPEHRAMADVRSTLEELHVFAQTMLVGRQTLSDAIGMST